MFTKACFDELGGNAGLIEEDQMRLQRRNLLGIVWNCGIKLMHRKSSSMSHCIFLLVFCLHVYLSGMTTGEPCPRLVCELPDIILALLKQLENQ